MNTNNINRFNPQTAMDRFAWAKKTAQGGDTHPNLNVIDGTLFRFSSGSQQVDTVQIRNREDMALETLTYDQKTLMHCVKPLGLRGEQSCVTHQVGNE